MRQDRQERQAEKHKNFSALSAIGDDYVFNGPLRQRRKKLKTGHFLIRYLSMQTQTAFIRVDVSRSIHTRLKTIAKKNRTPIAQIGREAIVHRLKELEAEDRAAEDQAILEREKKKRKPHMPVVPLTLQEEETAAAPPPDGIQPLIEEHALRLVQALGNQLELSTRKREAIVAIQKIAPLTCPSDGQILARLEVRVRELMPKQTPPPPLPSEPTRHPAQDAFNEILLQLAKRLDAAKDPLIGRSISTATKTVDVIEDSQEGE